MKVTDEMRSYLDSLEEERARAAEQARRCRDLGEDPSRDIEIPSAEDLADRVESLMELDGLAEAIRRYADQGLEREQVAFRIAEDIADGEFGDLSDLESVEKAVRTAVAILTEGVVAAPIEGIDRVDEVQGGGIQIYFAGPIRSAGGTAQAVAVLVADYVRQMVDLPEFSANWREVERAKEEIPLYKRSVNLQYEPPPEHIEIMMENCPIMVTGEPTEDTEVSGQRNLDRIPTNRLRSGFALVMAEGIALKAPKLKKFTDSLDIQGWDWLDDLMKKKKKGDDGDDGEEKDPGVNDKFLQDLIAGRPVFSHPSEPGGFRLRYGRSRNTGLATAGISPVTMEVVDEFLATGTQMKTELPGKAAGVAPVDTVEGPTLKLDDGEVLRIDTLQELEDLDRSIDEILDLGEILIGFGEFLENNHTLLPGSFSEERWRLEATGDPPADAEEALDRARNGEPLHPRYTYLWHDLDPRDAAHLRDGLLNGLTQEHKPHLETLLVPHRLDGDDVALDPDHRAVLDACILDAAPTGDEQDALEIVRTSGLDVRPRSPTRVGARMGRPEKAKEREMSPAVHCLFPLGEAGGSTRNVLDAVDATSRKTVRGFERVGKKGEIEVTIPVQTCDCGTETYRTKCPGCGRLLERGDPGRNTVALGEDYQRALDRVNTTGPDMVKGVKGLTSEGKVPEPLEKGVLRAEHGVSVFKDGTIRYDLTDMPLTHFRPAEVGTPVDTLRDMGYTEDVHGDPLRDPEQVLELKPQDVVVSEGCGDYLVNAANFVDDLLTTFYDDEPYYEVEAREDLVGELLVGLAPHTSAGVLSRLVGYTDAAAGYGHPYFHAAKRRNCDGDEDCVMLLMDGYLNFSKKYLPETRGGSVAEDSRLVAVGPDGDLRFVTFDELWEELDSPVERDGKFRKKTCLAEGWQTYAFDDDHGASLKPIEKAIRYRADEDETLLRVETQFGRSLDITEHHSLFRYRDGIEEVAGAELEEGDLVVAPRRLGVDTDGDPIDVAHLLDDPYVFIDDEVETFLTETWEAEDRGSPVRAEFGGGLSYRLSKQKIPLATLEDVAASAGAPPPDDILVGLKGSSRGIRRSVEMDETFAWLLGMFVAEGSLSADLPTIHGADKDLMDRVVEASRESLGTEPRLRWSNRSYEATFPAAFREVLYGLGFEDRDSYSSSEKIIPDRVLRAERSVALAFLRGLHAGDGSESSDDNHTTLGFHTTSPDVRDGIVFLLHRLGLVANVSTREREDPRQTSYTVTVSGGATDNPLRRILDGEDSYLPKSLVATVPDALMEIRGMDIPGIKQIIPKYLKRRENISLQKLRDIVSTLEERDLPGVAEERLDDIRPLVDGDLSYLRVKSVEEVPYDGWLYDLQVGGDPVFTANWLYAHNSMDAPLVLTTRIDPNEVDDEAHNLDVADSYPLELYEAADDLAGPKEVTDLVEIVEDNLGTPGQLEGFMFTHDTSRVDAGPPASSYKTLGTMEEKSRLQLSLGARIRAVDESDVATRVVQSHFLPDLIGNLRAFSSQKTRCVGCNTKYRRVPLTGVCTNCGGSLTLTVHEGSVKKYLDISQELAESYDLSTYTQQRLELLEREIKSVFQNDKFYQVGLNDFM